MRSSAPASRCPSSSSSSASRSASDAAGSRQAPLHKPEYHDRTDPQSPPPDRRSRPSPGTQPPISLRDATARYRAHKYLAAHLDTLSLFLRHPLVAARHRGSSTPSPHSRQPPLHKPEYHDITSPQSPPRARRSRPSPGTQPPISPRAARSRSRAAQSRAAHPATLRLFARTLLFAARRRGDGTPAPALRLRDAHLRPLRPSPARPDRRRRSSGGRGAEAAFRSET